MNRILVRIEYLFFVFSNSENMLIFRFSDCKDMGQNYSEWNRNEYNNK